VTRPELGRARWKRVRLTILERDEHTCQLCYRTADTVDHIVPAAYGGDDSPENLRALCRSCNATLGARVRHELHGRVRSFRHVGGRFLTSPSTPASPVDSLSPRGRMRRTVHVRIPGLDDLEDGDEASEDDPDSPAT
jgi:hypothetical protein